MRKTLFALSVLGTVAGTAHAQSSVTLYGLLDEGLMINTNAKNVVNGKNVGGHHNACSVLQENIVLVRAGRGRISSQTLRPRAGRSAKKSLIAWSPLCARRLRTQGRPQSGRRRKRSPFGRSLTSKSSRAPLRHANNDEIRPLSRLICCEHVRSCRRPRARPRRAPSPREEHVNESKSRVESSRCL